MNGRLFRTFAAIVLVAAACVGGVRPSPTPTPSPGPTLSVADLKLTLVDAYGPLWFCDPDFYPIQREDELASAKARWPEVVADVEAFAAIATRNGIDPNGPFTDAATLAIYQQWKMLNAVALDPIGNDTYRFDYLAQQKPNTAQGTRTAGTIKSDGTVKVDQQAAADAPICPICLARGTRIETPDGGVAVEDLRIGDPVWTLDPSGRRMPGTIIAVGSTVAPIDHHVVRLVLADGRTVTVSPGHPLADGRRIGELQAGDGVDGSIVVAADLLAYDGGRTFDIMVSGPTGNYLVDGIALGSTLQP